MKSVHKYNLVVRWANSKSDWNLTILAVSIDWVYLFAPKKEASDLIESITITLIERNCKGTMDSTFGAIIYTDNESLPKHLT